MKNNLSVVVIAYNNQDTIKKTFQSVQEITNDIILVDNYSTDKTVDIAQSFDAKVIYYQGENRGIQCQMGIDKTKNDWVLILDSDETVSDLLRSEIEFKVQSPKSKVKEDCYYVPFQSYYLGRKIYRGGENYKKLILFNKTKGQIQKLPIHYVWKTTGHIGQLKNKVDHDSYRNLLDLYKKFSLYAREEAKLKIKNGEKTSFKKIFLYPLHMFWARFIKDKGYKDGFFRIPLDLGFAYMEFLTYFSMLFFKK